MKRKILIVLLVNEEGKNEYWKINFQPQNDNHELTAKVILEQLNHSIFTDKKMNKHTWNMVNAIMMDFNDYFHDNYDHDRVKKEGILPWTDLKPFIIKALSEDKEYLVLKE